MSRIQSMMPRWSVGTAVALALMPFVSGCTPPAAPSGPSGPTTTDTRVAPAGKGVAMLDLFGNWFYVLRAPDGAAVFTQRGDFVMRSDGKLVYADKWYVQGFKADDEGEPRTDKLRDLKIVIGQASPVRATTRVELEGNVNPEDLEPGDTVATTFEVYDADGESTKIYVGGTLTAKDEASVLLRFDVRLTSANGTLLARATFRFDGEGNIVDQSVLQVSSSSPALSFDLELDGLTASSRIDSSIELDRQDGLGTGTLESYTIGKDGTIWGEFTNELKLRLGQFVIASFKSPGDLEPVAGRSDLFTETAESGPPRPAISTAR